MKAFMALILLGFGSGLFAQNIVSLEYYIDTDPGYGRGTTVPVPVGSNLDFNFVVNLASVSPGLHVLHLRAKDDAGFWSLTTSVSFVNRLVIEGNITYLEYFIDHDPGYGNGTSVNITPANNLALTFNVNLENVAAGFHVLYLRGKNERNEWSLTNAQIFFVEAVASGDQVPNITSIHWYYSKGGELSEEFKLSVPNPAPKVDELFIANLSSLVQNDTYNLHVYAKDSKNQRSAETIRRFKVTDNSPPLIRNFPDTVRFRNDGTQTINLWEIVTDLETPDAGLTYLFNVSNDSVIFSYNALAGLLILSAQANFSGSSLLRFEVRDPNSAFAQDSALVLVLSPSTAVEERHANLIPTEFELLQNYPNPFNPSTQITFALPSAQKVTLKVFDLTGKEVATLVQNEHKAPGVHAVMFNAKHLPSGIYLYRMQAGYPSASSGQGFVETKRMVLIK